MKISSVQAQLKSDDVLSIINEFVNVDGLKIETIQINKNLIIHGVFSKGITIKFNAEIDIQRVKDGKIYGRLLKFKVFNLGIFRPFRSLGIKMLTRNIEVKGIETDKDVIIIDINKILQEVPYIDINISDVYIKEEYIHVEVEEITISLQGNLIKAIEQNDENQKEENKVDEPINKIKDNYSIGRKNIEAKIPDNIKGISEYLLVIPDITALIYRLLKDKRVSIKTKLIIGAAISYVVFPTNIIPNKIPFIGEIDDFAVIFFAINKVVNDVSINIILENWEGENELVFVLKSSLEYIVNFTKAKNVEKLYKVILELKTL